MKHSKYLRDTSARDHNFDWIDIEKLVDFQVTFVGKMTVVAKNKKEVMEELKKIETYYQSAMNKLKISKVNIKP
jgi:hypothetical protein